MALPDDADTPTTDALLRTMALFATLSTAAEVWHAARERRAGRDPSGQEQPGPVLTYLAEVRPALDGHLMRLQAELVYAHHHEDDHEATFVRRFEHLMTLRHVARTLQTVHQRLLSLYPAVDEALVETARALQGRAEALIDTEADAFFEALGPFLRRALAFTTDLQAALDGLR